MSHFSHVMGRKTKTTSMKVDDKIYNQIKQLKNHHDLKEKSYQEFVNNTLAEKIIEIKKAKLIDSIGDDGLFSYVSRLDNIDKKNNEIEKRQLVTMRFMDEMGKRQKLTEQADVLGQQVLESIKNDDDKL